MKRWHFLIIALLIITGIAFLIGFEEAVAPANSMLILRTARTSRKY